MRPLKSIPPVFLYNFKKKKKKNLTYYTQIQKPTKVKF